MNEFGLVSARDHRTDFDLILVGEHLVFRDEFIAANDQVRLNNKIQFAQDVLRPFRPLEVDCAGGMAELDLHGLMIGLCPDGAQGAFRFLCGDDMGARPIRRSSTGRPNVRRKSGIR